MFGVRHPARQVQPIEGRWRLIRSISLSLGSKDSSQNAGHFRGDPTRAEPAPLLEPSGEIEGHGQVLSEPAREATAPRLTSRGYVTWIYAPPPRRRALHRLRAQRQLHRAPRHRASSRRGVPRRLLRRRAPRLRLQRPHGHPRAVGALRRDRGRRGARPGPFPYRYAFSDGAPMYNRIPQRRRAAAAGARLRAGRRRAAASTRTRRPTRTWRGSTPSRPPIRCHPSSPDGGTAAEDRFGLVKETLPPGSIVSFTRAFAAEGRTWLLSADQSLVPADRVRVFTPSTFHGVRLGGDVSLPARLDARRRPAAVPAPALGRVRRRPGARGRCARSRGSAGASVEHEGKRYLETLERDADGAPLFVSEKDATVARRRAGARHRRQAGPEVDRGEHHPGARSSPTRGSRPCTPRSCRRAAAACRAGARRRGRQHHARSAPTTSPSRTARPPCRPTSRAARARTSSPTSPTCSTSRPPFALHAAFWHERFGEPASAGCVNVSPIDAEALFALERPAGARRVAGRHRRRGARERRKTTADCRETLSAIRATMRGMTRARASAATRFLVLLAAAGCGSKSPAGTGAGGAGAAPPRTSSTNGSGGGLVFVEQRQHRYRRNDDGHRRRRARAAA